MEDEMHRIGELIGNGVGDCGWWRSCICGQGQREKLDAWTVLVITDTSWLDNWMRVEKRIINYMYLPLTGETSKERLHVGAPVCGVWKLHWAGRIGQEKSKGLASAILIVRASSGRTTIVRFPQPPRTASSLTNDYTANRYLGRPETGRLQIAGPAYSASIVSPHSRHVTTTPIATASTMASAVAVSIARASLRGGLLRPDPAAVTIDEIANFHALLDKALTICSPPNIQVDTHRHLLSLPVSIHTG